MELSFYNEAQKVWDTITKDVQQKPHDLDLSLHQKLIDVFHVGNYYFYFFDIKNLSFTYISPGTKKVLGFEPEELTVPLFMSRIHPDDQAVFLNHESAVIDFVKTLSNDRIGKYKFSYDYRVMNKSGHYVRILQQVVAMQFEDNNNLLLTMGVHTDISHLKKNTTSVLSFIGLDGEPSYIDVNVKEVYKVSGEIFTKREKEVLHFLLRGMQSQEIARQLFISKHTVDTHRKNILAKTNTKNTIELAMKVVSQGLV